MNSFSYRLFHRFISFHCLAFSFLFKITFNRQIMKELYAKNKRPLQPLPQRTIPTASRPNPCQPKPQPNIVHFSQYAHPRREDTHFKENRPRDNDPQPSTRGKPNVLLKDQRRSHQSTHEDPMRRTQKKQRANKGRTEWVPVEGEDGELGCKESLNAQHSKQGLTRSGGSTKNLAETGVRRMGDAELITEFQRKLQEVTWREQIQRLAELVRKQQECSSACPADYLPKQPNLTWLTRAVVVNWMMHLASEYYCRRQTLANAINLLDRYLSVSQPIQLDRLQLLGTVCLFIGQKLEDQQRIGIQRFWASVSQRHTQEDLKELELEVVIALGFRLRAPTVNAWANRLCAQWDLYVSTKDQQLEVTSVRFKSGSIESYQNYRMMVEFIDCSLLDIQTRQYKNRTLAAAFLFLTVLLRLQVHTPEEVATRFRLSSQLILAQTPFNVFFSTFLQDSFGFPLADILPAVQYASVFVVLPLGQEMPQVDRQGEPMSFEEYCGLQTFNPHQKAVLGKLNRQPW